MNFRIILFFITGLSFAQQITYSGSVADTLENPLSAANMLAIPVSNQSDIKFSITDDKGRYKLNLQKDSTYVLEISYLGFQKISDTIVALRDITRDFTMQPSKESLEEVLIKQRLPVLVKKDTIVYRTQVFKTGEERKLKEVLKKLPGVEVDRNGNVTVNGKKVTKLMVDGKTFFTGSTKLAVENIPADAVDEVEVLDHYSEVPFLKGLEDSDKMAMNIKLSKDKKKFVFGDLEAGGGIENRYVFHPTLFYYSPKTSINLIGDFNNAGQKSFSLSDYINFQGGILSLLEKPGGFDIYNDDFARFLRNEDFVYSKTEFGAFNIVQQINNKLDVNAYTIASKNKMQLLEDNTITYVNEGTGLDEFRRTKTENQLFFSLNKIQLRYIPDASGDLTYDAYVKTSNANANENINSFTPLDSTFINTIAQPTAIDFTQNIKYSKQSSYKHTTTATFNYKYSKKDNDMDWLFNRELFSGIIPFIAEGDTYKLLQNSASKTNKASMELTHYWVLNNTNHIYPSIGMDFLDQNFSSLDAQVLDSGAINSFQEAGFNNDTHFKLLDQFAGFQYKVKFGKFILKPGLFYHYYLWNVNQFNEEVANKAKPVLLPEFLGEYEINSSEKFQLKYNLNSRFSDAESFANRLRLTSFNRIFRGNENLENELYHSASLNYYKFSLFKGIFINANVSYSKRLKSVRTATIIEGIDQITTTIYSDLPEENYSFFGSFSKKINSLKFTLQGNAAFSNYQRFINNQNLAYKSKNYGYTFKTETSFKDLPNFEIGLRQRFNEFESDTFSNNFMQLDPYAQVEYDFLNAFIFKADYTYNYYENQNRNEINRFQTGKASLYYNKEDSPWGFEVEINNIFNTNFKRSNSFSQFIITDQRIFIQPRTILFKISYKL